MDWSLSFLKKKETKHSLCFFILEESEGKKEKMGGVGGKYLHACWLAKVCIDCLILEDICLPNLNFLPRTASNE
jgi:hypothetical protein